MILLLAVASHALAEAGREPATGAEELAREVATRGWIVYSSRTDTGTWDLFLMRPDSSAGRNLTQSKGYNEGGARFSPDGSRLLYYRMPQDTAMDNNTYGLYDLVLARADGTQPVVWGRQYPWACWGPMGKELACLTPAGIRIFEVESLREVRKLPRQGIVQQLGWSPDGRWFTGTANGLGIAWCVGVLNVETSQIRAVAETDRYNCTPDWWPDSRSVIYSRGIVPGAEGRAQLWRGYADGRPPMLLVAEEDRHLYGGCVSPDGAYLLFTRSVQDLGEVDISKTTMAICRVQDTPILIGPGDCDGMRERDPGARRGPVLDLPRGWEPDWTDVEID
jgi:Tol biopolymer transport system component